MLLKIRDFTAKRIPLETAIIHRIVSLSRPEAKERGTLFT
jgi:hypothetical protein